ncbi:MAG TPA: ubiquinone/menaquinone biosynthesis methyltransferase [bacterium]|nr:ubiquinone/menaquinone biosynthesis methyltransferase [bacterium]HOL95740.1 ubiquinone/menaquinone biosynthesis methyltransferase [bacterium]HPP00532.1 ubiquinone/menaquinone biosynthesis methyltransferase [bacterium]
MSHSTSPSRHPLPDASRKMDFVRQGFDAIASRYDLLNDLMTVGLHRLWKREAIRRLDLREGMKVLDLCAGTGDLARLAHARMRHRGLVTALDFSPNMMAAGRERGGTCMPDGNDRIVWTSGDACRLPFADETFDRVVVGFGLRNVVSIETALRETFRVLRPGGMLVSLDTAGPEWKGWRPLYMFHMEHVVPFLGRLFGGSREMYAYLASSSAAFPSPGELCTLFETCGFVDTGYGFRPRFIGGAALVWGRRPG